jgi:hypothetical protein
MKGVQFIGRFCGLAVALGTGAWLTSVPWLATADNGSWGLDAAALDAASALPSLPGAEADPSGLNIDISYNGSDVFHMGDGASATSGQGDLAIAIGDGATANAGKYDIAGLPDNYTGDYAFADGDGSTAIASVGDNDSATATDGGTAYSGFGVTPGAELGGGAYDNASASGAGSTADAEGNEFNSATATDGGTADSGFVYTPGHSWSGGIGDSASSDGAGSTAVAGYGNSDSASVSGTDSTATATFGNDDIANVLGDHSTALAGGLTGSTGDNDFAAVLGNDLLANATGANNLFVIEPMLFGDSAAALTPSDDFGLSSLLADLSALGI